MGALHGTVLNLNWQSGEYWLVPYEDKRQGTTKAQFQIGKSGMTQLCYRTNMYTKLHSVSIKTGEVVNIDPIQGTYEFKAVENRDTAETVGYYAYFTLTNGAKNESYWTKAKVIAHATEYSQSFRARTGNSPWLKHFDTMAENVVLYHLLKRVGPKSRDFAVAVRTNQSVLGDPYGSIVEYIDNPNSNGIRIIDKGAVKPEVKAEAKPEVIQSFRADPKLFTKVAKAIKEFGHDDNLERFKKDFKHQLAEEKEDSTPPAGQVRSDTDLEIDKNDLFET
jgi:recombinational DNA repair protein RecT